MTAFCQLRSRYLRFTPKPDGSEWATGYCIDPMLLLLPGQYRVSIAFANATFTHYFELQPQPVTEPIVFLGERCWGDIVSEGKPVYIFYNGFQPNEAITVTLYHLSEKTLAETFTGTGIVNTTVEKTVEKINTWTTKVEDSGQLVEYIAEAESPDLGTYALVVAGNDLRVLDLTAVTTALNEVEIGYSIEGTAVIYFSVVQTASSASQVAIEPIVIPSSISGRFPRLSTLIYVPAGEYEMGSVPSADPFAEKIERPQHMVYVSDFWIQRTEVNNARYAECVGAGACSPPPNSAPDYMRGHPVVNVTWAQAQAYCAWGGGRLPTEAEWEKAARYPDGRLYPWGNNKPTAILSNYANPTGDTRVVTDYPDGATSLGIVNMAGNVWEWVADWFAPDYYSVSPDKDPTGPATGKERVVRGGSYRSEPQFLRTTNRFSRDPNKGYDGVGFRCVTTTAP